MSDIAAIITAAGFSSRMNSFKPLLPMCSSTIIETAIKTFHSVGVRNIVVVTGNNAEVLKSHISYAGVVCLDSDYTRNTMFDSACIGLNYVKDRCRFVFFTPVDAPLFTRYSLKQLILRMNTFPKSVLCPSYERLPGHPLLINSNVIDEILCYKGTCGMKGAIKSLKQVEMINLPDPALVMDADTPVDYESLLNYAKSREVPSDIVCMKLHSYLNTKNNVQKHCLKVAEAAVSIAESLNRNGYQLDTDKIKAAALLHDILRYRKDHANQGANLLDDLGFSGISDIVRDHMELREYDVYHITEKSVVYLADKLVKEDSPVSLEEHFGEKLQHYKDGGDAYKSVEKRYKQALQIKKIIDIIIKSNIAL